MGAVNSRHDSTLSTPPDDLSGFPARSVTAQMPWYRIHSASRNALYFSWHERRFNLTLPRGTLNLVSSPHTGLREFFGATLVGARLLPESLLTGRVISTVYLAREHVANFSAPEAPVHGIVEADDMAPQPKGYELTRTWATTLDAAGFEGIIASARFGAEPDAQNFYLFGDAGEQRVCDIESEIPALAAAQTLPGVRVVKTPSSTELLVEN